MLNAPKHTASTDPWENLLALIRDQAELPAAKPYVAGAGDPLERLIRRMRGEDVDAPSEASVAPKNGAAPASAPTGSGRATPAAGVEAQLGREVMEMLRTATLPGPARAAAAELLSAQLYGLEAAGAGPSSAEIAAGLRKVLRILVTTQFD